MRVEDLEDALRTAADRQPPARGDLAAIRAGARRRNRTRLRLVTAACAVAVAVAGASTALVASEHDADDEVSVVGGDGRVRVPEGGTWEALPAAPLSPRSQVVGVWTGAELILVGGDTFLCPPSADCDRGPEPPLADGAILDLATTTWRAMTPSPVPFADAATAVAQGWVHFLIDQGRRVLAYSIHEDAWRELPSPPGPLTRLVATDGVLVAYAGTDEHGEVADQAYDPSTDSWVPLPADPLSPSFDRSLVWSAPHLYLFAHELVPNPGSAEPSLARAARLDPVTGTWERLADSEILGSPRFADGGLLVDPSLGGADGGEVNGWGRTYPYGGIFDTATARWQPLPPPPGQDGPGHDNSNGVIGTSSGLVVDGDAGLVLDLASMTWFQMPAAPDVGSDPYVRRTVVPVGRDAVAFGGEDWSAGEGELLGDAWIWRSPTPG